MQITLPNGEIREYQQGTTGLEIARSIGEGLAKAALAIEVNGELVDLTRPINDNSNIRLITGRDDEGLEIIRHDTAHILAQAVQRLFPETQVTIGPSIENGFYYDFARKESFTPDDLVKIEAEMQKIVEETHDIIRTEMERDEAIEFFLAKGEKYKAELIEAIPAGQTITFYKQGDFIDLCRGPHAPNTAAPKAFKLTKLAGAYWRGNSDNEMLQRIYGTAWSDKKQLKKYLVRLEEAEKRDHRKLGKELDLFHLQEEAVGQIFWHNKGWTLYKLVEEYIREKTLTNGYEEVKTPVLVDRKLWEKSGHWEKFRENMFTSGDDADGKVLALKPMNCPCHVQIFNHNQRSYRQLPLRMLEFGHCHRNEPSGSLHGIMRVRGFVQDDAHIFATEEQIGSETVRFCNLLLDVYKDFGFMDVKVKFSDRPDTRAGTDETWDKAEKSLLDALVETGLEWTLNKGEGAFYGPKLEFVLTDAIGRDWQCGTLQLDFVLPERLDANYIGADNEKHRPVMLHRAILGSLERFIGILIEQHAGRFPLWLAPTQVAVATITNVVDDYANEVVERLQQAGLRVVLDNSADKISYKVRQHSHALTPVILVIGEKERDEKAVSVRRLGSKQQIVTPLDELVDSLVAEVQNRG